MKKRTTILLLGAAQFVMVLDTTVMNVSISQVVADLDTTVPAVQLAITAYALVMAAFMLTGAKLGDMYGRRRIFSIGLGIYGTGSLITALSPNVGVLLVGWSFVEGIGAVLVIPAIAALTAGNYTGSERALAFSLLGGIAGAGVAAGPLIGGFVTSALTWRVVFAAETVVVTGVLLFGVRHIEDSGSPSGKKLDVVGAALSALGLGLIVFGILKSSQWGFVSIFPFLAAGGALLVAFKAWEGRRSAGGDPLVSPDLLSVRQLRAGLSMYLSSYLIMAGSFFVLPLYLQLVLGKDALETGIAILPISIAMILAALAGGRLADRVSPRRIVQAGLALLALSLVGLFASISPSLTSPLFSVSLAGFGGGLGLVVSQLGNVVMSSVDESRASESGGLQGAAQSLGSSLGTALIGAILLAGLTNGFHERIATDAAIPPAVERQLVTGTEQGVPMVSKEEAEESVTAAGLSTQEAEPVLDAYEDAQLEALKRALLAAALFALVALWLAGELPAAPLTQGRPIEASSVNT